MSAIIILIVLAIFVLTFLFIGHLINHKPINKLSTEPNITTDNEKKVYYYNKRPFFFTHYELIFYQELLEITKEMNITIFAKVRLADIIEPKKGSHNWQAAFTKIRSKHVDFILCENPQQKPLLVIELDDSSHDTQKRKERDAFVDNALSDAKIPILHVRGTKNLQGKINEMAEAIRQAKDKEGIASR